DNLNRAWLCAALLHDCSYDVEQSPLIPIRELSTKAHHPGYRLSRAGGIPPKVLAKDAATLWETRENWLDMSPRFQFHTSPVFPLLTRLYERQDHGVVGGSKLWEESRNDNMKAGGLSTVLEASAAAI